jgi:hypothetical protein
MHIGNGSMQIDMCKCCGKPKKPKNLSLVQQSITQTGAGALWIDGARVGVGEQWWERGDAPPDEATALMQGVHGRWPPNFCISHLPGCVRVGERQVKGSHDTTGIWTASAKNDGLTAKDRGMGFSHGMKTFHEPKAGYTDANGNETVDSWQCAPGCVVAAMDAQAGERKPPWGKGISISRTKSWKQSSTERIADHGKYQDGSNASRFFMTADWSLDIAERLAQADPVYYCAKAASSEREQGLRGHLACVGAHDPLVVHQDNPFVTTRHYRVDADGTPVLHSDGTPVWTPCRRNGHPTQKPLTLVQWLATLLLPPAAYAPRRLLIPFSGTASEGIGAMLAGWEEIVMIEQGQSYVDIARQRVAYWQQRRGLR